MDFLSGLAVGIPTFIILLGPLMLVHELGHFWAAKRAGIRVEEFGFGIPPRALTLFKRGETIFTLNWLPFGAFVRMTGEGLDDNMNDPRSFSRATIGWRFVTILAGPVMNFVAALVILFTANMLFATQPVAWAYRITAVTKGSPAESLGVLPGDMVLQVNGMDMGLDNAAVKRYSEQGGTPLTPIVRASLGKPVSLLVQRRDGLGTREVTLSGLLPATANPEAPLGVQLGLRSTRSERVPHTAASAFTESASELGNVAVAIPRVIGEVIAGRMPLQYARPVSPIGITQVGVEFARQIPEQGPYEFVRFAGLLSFLIGLSNLMPLPALDGGRLSFIILEWLRGRRVDARREQWVHAVGMMVLLGLFVVIATLDILMPIVP